MKKWLAKHPRFHFIPTSSSWLNLVERWFRELADKRIRRGVFPSVPELEAAIHEYLETNNKAPKPFVWTASAQDIQAKVERAAKTHAIVQNRYWHYTSQPAVMVADRRRVRRVSSTPHPLGYSNMNRCFRCEIRWVHRITLTRIDWKTYGD